MVARGKSLKMLRSLLICLGTFRKVLAADFFAKIRCEGAGYKRPENWHYPSKVLGDLILG
jgi:hypothetical protein